MKKLIFLLIIAVMTANLFSQSPQKMSYQCVVRNSSGALVANQSVGIKITILQGSSSGNVVYQETYNPNPETNANGLATVEIGGGVALSGTFSAINWASGIYFLKTETDPTGGTNYTISGTSQLLSVPYALHAKSAENGFSGAWTDITGKPTTISGYGITDADGSITNELQTMSLSGTQLTLSNGGGTVTLPSSGGGDNWGTQVVVTNSTITGTGTTGNPLAIANTIITPSWSNIQGIPAGFADGTDNIDDADNSITNEIQVLSISGSNLSLSQGGGSVVIPGDNWGTQTAVTDVTLTGNGTAATPLKIAQQSATTGQVLKWSGTNWSPDTDLSGSSIWSQSGSNIYFNGGNVGIGTSSPATYIHAYGVPITSRGQLTLSAPAGQDIFLSLYEADNFKAYLWYDDSDEDLRLQNFTAGDLNLNPYGGKVGIGTLNPTTTLDVSGIITATGGTFSNDLKINELTVGKGGGSFSNNTAIGYWALASNTTGYRNTAIGQNALVSNTTGYQNTAIGQNVLVSNTTGQRNTGNGQQALYSNTTGSSNTANGEHALYHNATGYQNTANGLEALFYNTEGSSNTASGFSALLSNTTGNNNTAIGFQANVASGALSNATAIGSDAVVNASNKVRIGNSSITVIEGQVNWSVGSDKRLKDNIEYSDKLGLEFINKLKTATFTYKNDSTKRHHDGLIAQDVNKVLDQLGLTFSGLVLSDNEEKTMNLSYSEFVIPLINAVQEQQKQIEELKQLVNNLMNK